MARPRSDDKLLAILSAATEVIATDGLVASTVKIAKQAGVAEGTLFCYFATKDTLFNELYLHIKCGFSQAVKANYDSNAPLKNRAQSVWDSYIDWGLAHPAASKTLSQLLLSDKITAETKAKMYNHFPDINALMDDMCVADEVLARQTSAFGSALLAALAGVTLDFVMKEPAQVAAYKATGFDVMWRGLTQQ